MAYKIQQFLSSGELELLLKTFHPATKSFQRGETILNQETSENRFCFLLSGIAYLEIENEYSTVQILDYFLKGQVLCKDMLVQPDNSQCYVIAKRPCLIAYVEPSEIEKSRQVYSREPLSGLSDVLFQSLVSAPRLHCHILQQKTIRQKLLAYLQYQFSLQGSQVIRISIPYSDLADYLSVDRSAMMKELTRLCQENKIEKKAHSIRLLS